MNRPEKLPGLGAQWEDSAERVADLPVAQVPNVELGALANGERLTLKNVIALREMNPRGKSRGNVAGVCDVHFSHEVAIEPKWIPARRHLHGTWAAHRQLVSQPVSRINREHVRQQTSQATGLGKSNTGLRNAGHAREFSCVYQSRFARAKGDWR